MALRKKSDDAGKAAPRTATRTAGRPGRQAKDADTPGRMAQIRTVYKVSRQRDPRILWITLAALLGPVVVGVLLGLFVGPIYLWIPIGVLVGLVLAINIFSRRVQRSAYAEMEGKPGVAPTIVERMRGDWRVTPAVQVNRNQDLVHRVIGRPGVVLIAEGRGRGVRDLLRNETQKVRRVVGNDVPVTEIIVGNGEGETPLGRVQPTLMRMKRELKRGEVDAVEKRLRAIRGTTLPIPKGPIPRSVPRGKVR